MKKKAYVAHFSHCHEKHGSARVRHLTRAP